MKRFLFTADVKKVEGSQVFYVDAETPDEAADIMARSGGNIYTEELSVMDVSPPRPDGETVLTDFGDFPPKLPEWDQGEISNERLERYIDDCVHHRCQMLRVGFEVEVARQLLATRRQVEELTIGNAVTSAEVNSSIVFPLSIPGELHPDTRQLVLDTARAMAAKLLKAQEKYGFGNDWKVEPDGSGSNPHWDRATCISHFYQHLAKGDPLDCINYLAFMRANGWEIEHLVPLGWVPCSPEWIEAGGECDHAPRIAFGSMGKHYHPAVGTHGWSGKAVSVQEAWLACGGNPVIKATAGDLLAALRAMRGALDVLDRSQVEKAAEPEQRPMLTGGRLPGKSTLLDRARQLEQEAADLARRVADEDVRGNVRAEHAKWAADTFGDTGPVGPLKHLSREALEAAEAPGDLSEWADMQFLLWDAQRKAGVSDEQITEAMVAKLEVNKARQWPEPKDGEPRFHIKDGDL